MSSRVGSRLVRSSALAALLFAALASPRLATQRLAAQSAPAQPARPVFADGQAQIVPAFEDEKLWIRQTLFVETEFDSDGDGQRDRMFVDVTRPRQTDTEGLKVPVLYESSPYFAGTSGNRQFLWDVKQELGEPPPPRTSQAADRVQGRHARMSRRRSSRRGCRAASPSCTRTRRARASPRAASRSALIRSSWRRRR